MMSPMLQYGADREDVLEFTDAEFERIICGTLIREKDELFLIYALTLGRCGGISVAGRLQDAYMLWKKIPPRLFAPKPVFSISCPHWLRVERRRSMVASFLYENEPNEGKSHAV